MWAMQWNRQQHASETETLLDIQRVKLQQVDKLNMLYLI